MREIKFRAWDKKNNHMWQTGSDGAGIDNWTFSTYFDPNNRELKAIIYGPDYLVTDDPYNMYDREEIQLPIMQYTGLKDKNGKEIYEEDIVNDSFGNRKGRIRYNKYIASFELADYDGIHLLSSINCEKFFEVIGNIYEDPKLLPK